MIKQQVVPSILNVPKDERVDVINNLMEMGIKWFHYDVMDNKFVPNEAITVDEIKLFKEKCKKHLSDVHLMVNDPFKYAYELKDYVTCLTIHYESFKNEEDIVKFVDEFSHTNWIGIAIKPSTDFKKIQHILYLFDLVLIMSVEPGFGGQPFIDKTYSKLKEIKEFIDEEKLPTVIQIDGGINDLNSKKLFKQGSLFNVVGSYLIKNLNKETLKKLL